MKAGSIHQAGIALHGKNVYQIFQQFSFKTTGKRISVGKLTKPDSSGKCP